MALSHAHGAIQWLAADPATTIYTVSGLTFQPTGIRFYTQGLGSSTDANSQTANSQRSIGFAASASDRRCVATLDTDAAGSMTCATAYLANDGIALLLNSTPGQAGRLDMNTITSDGFTVIVDLQAAVNITVFWEAWGGTSVNTTLVITEPAATGNVDYTVTGFTASPGNDQVVMLAGVQATGSGVARNDSGLCIGFAAGATPANVVVLGNNDDGSANSDTDGYCQTGECLAMIIVAGGNPNARAALTQWNTDGFRLNWIARGVTGRVYIALCLKGGNWNVGSYTIDGTTINSTATVSGLAYQPIGLSLIGRMTVQDTAGTSTIQDRMSLGIGSSTTSRRAMGHLSEDGTGNAEIDLTLQYDQVLAFPDNVGGVAALYDLNAINSDGFQIITDSALGVVNEWQGYLVFGNATAAYTLNLEPGNYSVTGAALTLLAARLLALEAGSYTSTGQAATFAKGYLLNLESGLYNLSGADLRMLADRLLALNAGTYLLTGTSLAALADRLLALAAGAYSLNGQSLTTLADRLLNLAAGQYTLTGAAANLNAARLLVLDTGIYLYNGFDAALIYAPVGGYVLNLEPGVYTLLGQDTTLAVSGIAPPPAPALVVSGGGYVRGRYAEKMSLAEWRMKLWGRRLSKLREADTFEEAISETEDDLIELILGL